MKDYSMHPVCGIKAWLYELQPGVLGLLGGLKKKFVTQLMPNLILLWAS